MPQLPPQQLGDPITQSADKGELIAWRLSRVIVIIAGVASVALGLIVIAGWQTHNVLLVQVGVSFAPMQYNTALGFVLCGIGLLALTWRRLRVSAVCSVGVGAIGLLTSLQYLLSANLGIDQLFMASSITVQTSYPGRMAPNTALCFTLAGMALWVMSVSSTRRKRILLFAGPLGSIVMALGLYIIFKKKDWL